MSDAPKLERVIDLASRYRSLPPPEERQRLKAKFDLTYAQMGQALGVTRECAWRWTLGSRTPRWEHYETWVRFWETLMALEREEKASGRSST